MPQSVHFQLHETQFSLLTCAYATLSLQLLDSWASASFLGGNLPQVGGAVGGERITVMGNGFDTSGAVQYRCDFAIDCCVPADSPTCDLSTCTTRSESSSTYASTATTLHCITPAWGSKYAFTGSHNAAQSHARLSVINLGRGVGIQMTGAVASQKLGFEQRWEYVAPKRVPISGAQVTIFGAGFDSDCATSLRGCYKCTFSAPAATTLYGGAVPCADSSCTGTLATPTSPLEVTCAMADWGAINAGGVITVTLYHGNGDVVKHATAATPPSGTTADTEIASVEAWSAHAHLQPLYMKTNTAVTITGSGFDTTANYKCVAMRMVLPSVPCLVDADCQAGLQPSCSSMMTCISALCARKLVSGEVQPATQASLTCVVPGAAWGACFTAASLTLTLEKQTNGVYATVLYGGAANTLPYIESWHAMAPLSGSKFGGDLLIIQGSGFDGAAAYKCRFSLSGVDLEVPTSLTTPKELRCITPNWAEESGLGGSGGPAVFAILKGVTAIDTTSPTAVFTFTVSLAHDHRLHAVRASPSCISSVTYT
jgi:hypothetical protein